MSKMTATVKKIFALAQEVNETEDRMQIVMAINDAEKIVEDYAQEKVEQERVILLDGVTSLLKEIEQLRNGIDVIEKMNISNMPKGETNLVIAIRNYSKKLLNKNKG